MQAVGSAATPSRFAQTAERLLKPSPQSASQSPQGVKLRRSCRPVTAQLVVLHGRRFPGLAAASQSTLPACLRRHRRLPQVKNVKLESLKLLGLKHATKDLLEHSPCRADARELTRDSMHAAIALIPSSYLQRVEVSMNLEQPSRVWLWWTREWASYRRAALKRGAHEPSMELMHATVRVWTPPSHAAEQGPQSEAAQ